MLHHHFLTTHIHVLMQWTPKKQVKMGRKISKIGKSHLVYSFGLPDPHLRVCLCAGSVHSALILALGMLHHYLK